MRFAFFNPKLKVLIVPSNDSRTAAFETLLTCMCLPNLLQTQIAIRPSCLQVVGLISLAYAKLKILEDQHLLYDPNFWVKSF